MSLATLVAKPDEIIANWPTTPQLTRHDPHAFDDLLTLAEVDELIDHECVAARNVVCIKDGAVIERYEYVDGEHVRPGAIRAHLDQGGTISLRDLQTVKPALARLRQQIHEETGCLAHVNAYMTPAGNQGLKYHYDPYVTLIIQLAGRKTWPLHKPFFPNPMKEYGNFLGRGWTDEQLHYLANTPPAQSFTLEPGDVFWLPRGYAHSPHTVGDETSLHITLALKERTRQWVAEKIAEEVLAQAIIDPAMRQEVQPSHILSGPDSAVAEMRNYLLGALLTMDERHMTELIRTAALANQ